MIDIANRKRSKFIGDIAALSAGLILASLATLVQAAAPTARFVDSSPHKVRLVPVREGASLEVLDWGGRGPPVVLLAGLPHTAHVFDDFALRLTKDHRVIGITRLGFGSSSAPASGYSSDELADADLEVVKALHLDRPLFIGHSVAGLELSSIASRHPEKVRGVVYLDGRFSADPDFDAKLFYAVPTWRQHFDALEAKLAELKKEPSDPDALIEELLYRTWPAFAQDMKDFLSANRARPPRPPAQPEDLQSYAAVRAWYARGSGISLPEAEFRQILAVDAHGRIQIRFRQPTYVNVAIRSGSRKYLNVTAPALGIFAVWDKPKPSDPADAEAAEDARNYANKQAAYVAYELSEFRKLGPSVRAVKVHLADHYVFLSNTDQVLAEIREFERSLRLAVAAQP